MQLKDYFMKKLKYLFLMLLMLSLIFLSSCTVDVVVDNSSTSQSTTSSESAVSQETSEDTEQQEQSEGISSLYENEPQPNPITDEEYIDLYPPLSNDGNAELVTELIMSSDTVRLQLITVELTDEMKEDILEMLYLDTWLRYEQPGRGGPENSAPIFEGENGISIAFEGASALASIFSDTVISEVVLFTFDPQIGVKIDEYVKDLADEQMAVGYAPFEETVLGFNKIIDGEYDYWYEELPEEVLIEVPSEEFAAAMDVRSWRIYDGSYEFVFEPEYTPLITLYNYVEYEDGYVSGHILEIYEFEGQYVADCMYYEGPNGQSYYVVPQTVLEALLELKGE